VKNKFVLVVFVPAAFVHVIFVGFNEETDRFVNVPLVANKFVDVVSVKIAVAGVVSPIVVPLMVPPLIVTLGVVRDPIVAIFAFRIVPEAMDDQEKFVLVAPVASAEKATVRRVVANKSVPVALPNPRRLMVPEAAVRLFETERFVLETAPKVELADTMDWAVRAPMVAVFALKVVPEAVTKVRFVLETFASVELAAMSDPITPLLE
jgi:hypothetical protein